MLIVLKLGGSVLTDKNREFVFKSRTMKRLAKEITAAKYAKDFDLVIVHGAGSFGHILAKRYGITSSFSGNDPSAVKKINDSMRIMDKKVVDTLNKNGLNSAAFSSKIVVRGGRIVNMDIEQLKKMISNGIVPVLYGNVFQDLELGYVVVSGDQIASFIAKEMDVDKVIMGCDVDGVYRKNPMLYPKQNVVRVITAENVKKFDIGASAGVDVSGGMWGKISELLELAKIGVRSQIININRSDMLKNALMDNEVVSTMIIPNKMH